MMKVHAHQWRWLGVSWFRFTRLPGGPWFVCQITIRFGRRKRLEVTYR